MECASFLVNGAELYFNNAKRFYVVRKTHTGKLIMYNTDY